jgi:hypothetical protein
MSIKKVLRGVTVVDTEPLENFIEEVDAEVAKKIDIKMDGLYELNHQRYDDEIVETFIEKDKQERGKTNKKITGEFDFMEPDGDKKKVTTLATLGQKKKLTMAVLEKAKEHYGKTEEKHKKEMEGMTKMIDS